MGLLHHYCRFQRPPGALPSSMLGYEALTGGLDDFAFEDYLNCMNFSLFTSSLLFPLSFFFHCIVFIAIQCFLYVVIILVMVVQYSLQQDASVISFMLIPIETEIGWIGVKFCALPLALLLRDNHHISQPQLDS